MGYWIVVVDDDAMALTHVKNILREQDMRVSCLRSGRDLLKFMTKNAPDLVLLDIQMPEMDGFETYQALRHIETDAGREPTPIIFLSGMETSDAEILSLRRRQMKNMLTVLLTSRGVPMLLSGDEFANTQFGNNNAYCQDNEISWLDWNMLDENSDLYLYEKNLIALRKAHPVLRGGSFDFSHNGTGYPELSFHGLTPWNCDTGSSPLTIAWMYAEDSERYGTAEDAFLYVAVNAHWEEHTFALPVVPEGYRWHLFAESGSGRSFAPGEEQLLGDCGEWTLMPRSSAILIAKKAKKRRGKS